MKTYEVNFDGLIGPSHHFGGLSYGNVASMKHTGNVSNPRQAALQGLNKMKFLHDLGIKQAILPPHERPFLKILRQLGFKGNNKRILQNANQELLTACSSSAAMWTANAATVTPSSDSLDGKVHFTPANLCSKFHRSIEKEFTAAVLKKIFLDKKFFKHHMSLPSSSYFADEGAANHVRLCKSYGEQGVHLFIYGREGFRTDSLDPKIFPARQTLEASETIARTHGINNQVIFLRQNPLAIDAGVFHNDVISTGNEHLFLYHELAFEGGDAFVRELQKASFPIQLVKVLESEISLHEAVSTYLFNSQIVSLKTGRMALIAPQECKENKKVKQFLERLKCDVYYMDLRESMLNGGGPACLRLRVVLKEIELQACLQSVLFTDELYKKLVHFVTTHYRDKLHVKDLRDLQFLKECYAALNELTHILNLGPIYNFQHGKYKD